MGLLRGLAERAISYQDVFGKGADLEDGWESVSGVGTSTRAGRRVNEDTALRHTAVYASVSLISEITSGLPIEVYRPDALGESPTEHVRTPNFLSEWPDGSDLPRAEVIQRVLAGSLLTGNGYAFAVRTNPTVSPDYLVPLLPKHVTPKRIAPGAPIEYEVQLPDGTTEMVPAWQMFHVPAFSVGGLCGLSPISYFRETIGTGLAAEQFTAQWMGDGAAPSSILSTEQSMDEEEAKRNQQAWIESHGGRRHPAFLSGGLKWEAITISPDDAAAIDTEKWSVAQVARVYRVPPHMIGDLSHATFSNIEHQGIEFVTYTLRPWLTRLEQRLYRFLPGRRVARFDTDDLLRGDLLSRLQAYSIGRQISLWNANDLREKEGEPKIDDPAADSYVQPLNWGPLGADPSTSGTPTDVTNTGGAQP